MQLKDDGDDATPRIRRLDERAIALRVASDTNVPRETGQWSPIMARRVRRSLSPAS
jgi:hypothetical protein